MKAKLIIEGKEFDIQIMDPELQKLLKPPKKTGYERDAATNKYWYVDADDCIEEDFDAQQSLDHDMYQRANYYSDKTVAEGNARADKLMRQLRRFAVEHREYEMNWEDTQAIKYYIYYDYLTSRIWIDYDCRNRQFGAICFNSRETAELAIEKFRGELIWYFTEYKDSL